MDGFLKRIFLGDLNPLKAKQLLLHQGSYYKGSAKVGSDLFKSALILMQSRILELRKIYDKYALEEDTINISVQDIAQDIFESDKLEPAQLLAIQIFLMKEHTHFITDITSLTEYGNVEIRPQ